MKKTKGTPRKNDTKKGGNWDSVMETRCVLRVSLRGIWSNYRKRLRRPRSVLSLKVM
jgi:hypothetical protein